MKMKVGEIKAVPAPIKDFSSRQRHFPKKYVKVLKRHQYCVKPERISGDAPKDLICVYEYGRSRKANTETWIQYIAKIGNKRYPSESITEHLLTRLGQEFGFNMAESKLYVVSGQLRFCSEIFRGKEQELVHGADILSRHLQEADANFIEQIDKKKWSQELLSLQFVRQAIKEVFPDEAKKIIEELHKMLLFDAIVGNNDRHFFNWGVLRHLKSKHKPYFSPIYDTARGLFWNYTDESFVTLQRNRKQLSDKIVKYHKETRPKIGWEGDKEINHFDMVERMLINNDCAFDYAKALFSNNNLTKAEILLNTEFNGLISEIRKEMIMRYLAFRFEAFNKLINS